jgi:hypothetical protein
MSPDNGTPPEAAIDGHAEERASEPQPMAPPAPGHRHKRRMENVVGRGAKVQIPPRAGRQSAGVARSVVAEPDHRGIVDSLHRVLGARDRQHAVHRGTALHEHHPASRLSSAAHGRD